MKTRIISGAVAIALLVGLTALHSTVIFNIGFALIGVLAVYEIFRAEKLEKEGDLFLAASAFFAFEFPVSVRPSVRGLRAAVRRRATSDRSCTVYSLLFCIYCNCYNYFTLQA